MAKRKARASETVESIKNSMGRKAVRNVRAAVRRDVSLELRVQALELRQQKVVKEMRNVMFALRSLGPIA